MSDQELNLEPIDSQSKSSNNEDVQQQEDNNNEPPLTIFSKGFKVEKNQVEQKQQQIDFDQQNISQEQPIQNNQSKEDESPKYLSFEKQPEEGEIQFNQFNNNQDIQEPQSEQIKEADKEEKEIDDLQKLYDAIGKDKQQQEQDIDKQKQEIEEQGEVSSAEDSPDQKTERQNTIILKTQRLYMLEVQERNDEAIRIELIEQLKTQFAFKQAHPFDLFIMYDDALVEFQIRLDELDHALKTISIELQQDQKRIVQKYYRIPKMETISTIKLCCSLVEDLGELVMMAINYIVNKYRLLLDIFFEEVTGPDKLISVETLKLLNREWMWGLDEGKLQQIYNLMTDYGNNIYNFQVFKQKLSKIAEQVDKKFNQNAYQNIAKSIIQNGSIEKIFNLLRDEDQGMTDEIQIQKFLAIITKFIERALSKQELLAIRKYLAKDKDEDIIIYSKLINDAQKLIEDEKTQKQQEQEKLKLVQKEIILEYFKSVVEKSLTLPDQYFKAEQLFKMDKETFIEQTIILTGFIIDKDKALQIYEMIRDDKIDKDEEDINVIEFTQFINKRKQEIAQSEQEKVQQSKEAQEKIEQSKGNSQQILQPPSLLKQGQSQQGQSLRQQLQLPLSAISQPQSALKEKQSVLQQASSRQQEKSSERQQDKVSEKQIEKDNNKDKDNKDKDKDNKEKDNKDNNKDKDNKEKEKEKLQQLQSISLRNDIYCLFNELDEQKVKLLTQQQMFSGLLKIGVIIKGSELLNQKSYDYFSFEKVIMQQLKQFFNSAKLIYNLKKEMDQYKEEESDIVNIPLLKTLFEKIRLNVKFEDIQYLFSILDKEGQGNIKLSNLFYLIHIHPILDYKLNELLFRMKGYYDNSLKMHKVLYSKLPLNYCRPFTSKANLPSYAFRYKLDLLGDIQIHPSCSANNLCKIKLLEAQGIPSPKDKSTCFKREIVVAIYDNFYKQFVENSLVLKAKYLPENEDIWYFPVKNRNNGFYLNCENQKEKLNLILVFEFISYFKENNQVHKISCCFAEIPVAHIMRLGTYILPLKGGSIEQVVSIAKEDIRCKRGGISGLITRLSGDVQPQLKIISMNKSNRPQLQKELQMLPPLCLCHRNMTQIIQTYRIFCEDKLKQDESVFIQSIDTFLFCLDCPYICSKMCKLWNRIIQGKMIGQEIASFQILIGQLQKLIRLKDFNFNPYSPQEVFTPEISKPKRNVVKSIFEYAEYLIDSSFFNKLGLDGDEILKEQMDLYGQPLIQGIFDGGHNPFDKYYNGLNLKAYETYVQQL